MVRQRGHDETGQRRLLCTERASGGPGPMPPERGVDGKAHIQIQGAQRAGYSQQGG